MRNTTPRRGKIEQAILAELARLPSYTGLTGAAIADRIGHGAASPALKASVRRAVLRLRDKGLAVKVDDLWMLTKRHRREEAAQRRRERARQREEDEARARAYEREESAQMDGSERKQSAPTTRLVRLLGMLGSAHDGEVLSAARKIEAERLRLGQTWEELLRGGQRITFDF